MAVICLHLLGAMLTYAQEPSSLSDRLAEALVGEDGPDLLDIYLKQRVNGPLPQDENELNNLGYQLLNDGESRDAIQVFELAVGLFPGKANPHDSLGEALLLTGQYRDSVAAYRRAFEIDHDRGTWDRLGVAIRALGDVNEVSAYGREGLARYGDPTAHDVDFAMRLEFELVADPSAAFAGLTKQFPGHGFWRSRLNLARAGVEVADVDDGWKVSEASLATIADAIERRQGEGTLDRLHGVVVVKNGAIVFEWYPVSYSRYRPHDTRSAGKSVTALVAGIAMDQGKLALDTRLFDLFPEIREKQNWVPGKNAIQIRHLLAMSSGLDAYDDRESPGNENYYQANVRDWLGHALNLPMAFEPGSVLVYASADYLILGAAVSRAIGKPLDQFAHQHLFEPLGIVDYQWFRTPAGDAYGAGGLQMTPRDLAKLGALVLGKGRYGDRQVVSQSWIDQLNVPAYTGQLFSKNYSYGWYVHDEKVNDRNVQVVSAAGNGGQRLWVIPDLKAIVVVTMGHFNSPKQRQADDLIRQVLLPIL